MKDVEIVVAVIVNARKVLCLRRKESPYKYISKKWEFPGGKIEEGESQIFALHREIKEELDMKINIKKNFYLPVIRIPIFQF